MIKVRKIKLFLIIITLPALISGCDKSNSSEDIIKIVSPDGHDIVKNIHSAKQEDLLNLGAINMRAGKLQESIQSLEKFTTYYPHNPVGQLYLGRAYYADQRYDQAIKRFKRAYVLDKSSPDPLLYLGKAYDKAGNTAKAIKSIYKYILEEQDQLSKQKAADQINLYAKPITGKGIIGRVSVTDRVIKENNLALTSKACFSRKIPEVFASVEVIEAPYDTEIEARWLYVVSEEKKMEVNSASFSLTGSKNALVTLKKPSQDWPVGEYNLEILVNNEKNTSLTFYVF